MNAELNLTKLKAKSFDPYAFFKTTIMRFFCRPSMTNFLKK